MKLKPATRLMPIAEPDIEDDLEEAVFYPVVRISSWCPFGYEEDPEDSSVLQPIPAELILLEKAKDYLKLGFSLREVAAWLSTQSGRKISHQGLKDRVATDQKRQKEYANARYLLKQLVEAYKKAKKIEAIRTGRADPDEVALEEEMFELLKRKGGTFGIKE